jgi:hypothetical protein
MDVDRRVVGVRDASDDRESEPGTGQCSGGGCSVEAFRRCAGDLLLLMPGPSSVTDTRPLATATRTAVSGDSI